MRLALYGILRPGGSHHHEVRSIPGDWETGTVRGWLHGVTWGPADGFEGITLAAEAPPVPVDILHADRLADHLARLDRFEGPGYDRLAIGTVHVAGELLEVDGYVVPTRRRDVCGPGTWTLEGFLADPARRDWVAAIRRGHDHPAG